MNETAFKFKVGEIARDSNDRNVEIMEVLHRGKFFAARKQYKVRTKVLWWWRESFELEEFLTKKTSV